MSDEPVEPPERRKRNRRAEDQKQPLIPRPPQSRNSTDFIVTVFVVTVGTILIALTLGLIIGGALGNDVSSYFNTLTDILTTIIGALVGFIAGKGQGRTEAHEENKVAIEAAKIEQQRKDEQK